MADTFSKLQRSKIMSSIRSTGNRSTEMTLIFLMRTNNISGWRRQRKTMVGKPDFVFPRRKISVFVDGCYWHGCKKCNLKPKSNNFYWDKKITRNKERDIEVNKELRKKGWHVIRIWEHQLKNKKIPKSLLRYLKK